MSKKCKIGFIFILTIFLIGNLLLDTPCENNFSSTNSIKVKTDKFFLFLFLF